VGMAKLSCSLGLDYFGLTAAVTVLEGNAIEGRLNARLLLQFLPALRHSQAKIRGSAAISCCVYSCLGWEKYLGCRSAFYDCTVVKNGDAVTNSRDRRQIMRDVKNGHSCGAI